MSVTWVQHRREVGAIIQLPEHGDRVLVTAAMRRHNDGSLSDFYVDVAEAQVENGTAGFHRDGFWISNVVAWAPLPEPWDGSGYGMRAPELEPVPLERYRESGGFIVGYDGVPLVGEEVVDKLNELLDAATRTIRAEEALKAAKVAYLMDLAKHEEKLRFERERINRVSALLKQRGYAPIDGAVGAYAEGLVAVFRDLDEAHARAERAESEFRGVARMQA